MSNSSDKQRLLSDHEHDRYSDTDSDCTLIDGKTQRRSEGRSQPLRSFRTAIILVLVVVISNLASTFFTIYSLRPSAVQAPVRTTVKEDTHGSGEAIPDTYPILEELPTSYERFKWWTAWGMEAGANNDTNLPSAHVADELWEGILPSHGLIAVDRTWAKEQHWPDSMYLPKDPHGKEKGVYLLEGYHMLHCLSIVRLSFVEARRGLPLTWPPGHTTHCFDALRQSIMCHADNTPLYTFGDSTAGDGQLRKCKSWDALRDFATENTACYVDSVKDILLRDHFGYCEEGKPYQDGKDGLP